MKIQLSYILLSTYLLFGINVLSGAINSNDAANLYLDLMQKCLINIIYKDAGRPSGTYNENARINGQDWPEVAHSMIGLKRLKNIQFCAEQVIKNNIPGDFIETGVWRGGATIFMRAVLKAYNILNRKVWVADSFEGLPKVNTTAYPADDGMGFLHHCKELAVSLEQVKENFKCYDLLDDQVCFLKGWFKDTLPTAPIEKLAVLRLDGDYYESTIQVLNALYPKLSIGGYIIIDDFGAITACKKAVEDYRKANNITEPMISVDYSGVFWQKTK